MILISHRGNINDKNTERENHPDYIELLKDILKKVAPYNEVLNQLKTI